MSYWAAVRLEPQRERLVLHCLGVAGYVTYVPRIAERRALRGRVVKAPAPLFPGYAFLVVESRWYSARWSAGVIGLIMDGIVPARVPDSVIDSLRRREVGGYIALPPPPRPSSGLTLGERVRINAGAVLRMFRIGAGHAQRRARRGAARALGPRRARKGGRHAGLARQRLPMLRRHTYANGA